MIKRIGVIFNKEVIDNLRDKRSLTSTFTSALITPLTLLMMIFLLGQMFNSNPDEKPLKVPVLGAENAPALISFLEQNGAQILPAPADPQQAVREGEAEVVLVIPEKYGESFSQSSPAEVQLILDASRTGNTITLEQVNGLLNGYNRLVGSQRLMVRGINPQVTQVISIDRVDVSTPQSRTMIFLYMLPFILIMNIFMGGMHVIVDATAGERERNSLEPLLINPARRSEMVLGKQLASLPFAMTGLLLTLVVFGLIFNLVPIEQYLGMPMSLSISALWVIFWLSVPMLLLASSLQMIVASFSRSFKEAQTYLGFMPLIAGLPGMVVGFLAIKPALDTMLIPIFGQTLLINQLMRGETMNPFYILITTLTTLVAALLLTGVAIKLYQREQILFGKK
ncbi:MAG: ABC transporter permease [Anaerolineae bacterium]|nr:ABC transporter permease [Anaerolineae bacterium]